MDIHLSTAGNAQGPEAAALALDVWNSLLVKEDVLLRHLTKVNFKGFLGGPLELAAVEFFFKKASRLKQLSIKWTGRQHIDVIRQLSYFARASPDAVLRFEGQFSSE
ncbi:hypothetical protein AQUCO_04900054v1 [Aquilegia coerulea]|uniref:FBD domain-containing protein n=1 Tax=Aquilegia coerulea TaxID=218851 RepID=A0A2G5CJJ5_AQUCA|nr:hypothetical protein AQUCO_04900054v1 [Aquilegia coerulea]